MDVRIPLAVANNHDKETYDNVEEDEENENEEIQSDHLSQEDEDEVVKSEEMYDQDKFTKPSKQNNQKGQSSAPHISNLPPLYPNPYQYQPFVNPNLPPYSMLAAGAPLSPEFIPFNYYKPAQSPANVQESHMVTSKPPKKKPSSNSKKPAKDSNKQSTPTEKPNTEYSEYDDSSEITKPSKPSRKDKPMASTNPNQMYPDGANSFLGQNQNAPIINPINSFNANPYNNQFSNGFPFYSNGFGPFLNYINPPNGFNGVNDFPSQFGPTNPMNPYGNNPYVTKNVGTTIPYQNNPNFNIPRNFNSPFAAYQTMNQKFNGYPQYFVNPSSNSN